MWRTAKSVIGRGGVVNGFLLSENVDEKSMGSYSGQTTYIQNTSKPKS